MENKNAVVTENTNELLPTEPEIINDAVFDKNAMRQDLTDGLKEFGIGCCNAGKEYLAPLAATMLKHFFNWIIDSALK